MFDPGEGQRLRTVDTTPKASSRIWLAVLLGGALLAVLGLRSLDSQAQAVRAAEAVSRPVGEVAIQADDLPERFERCPFSGDMDSYLGYLRGINIALYRANLANWNELKRAGATEGYATYFGDSEEACDSVGRPEPADAARPAADPRPATAWSVVIRFKDPAAAAEAYASDIFGHSTLKRQVGMQLVEGTTTGLGPNSILGTIVVSGVPLHKAVWQRGGFDVLAASENLSSADFDRMTTAIDSRMRP